MSGAYYRYPPTASGDGVPTYANQGALPATAADGAVAVTLDTDTIWVFNLGALTWYPVGTTTTVTTLGPVGAAPNANAGLITGNTLVLEPADATHPGVITSGTQTIGGAKTFSGAITASNLSGTNTGDQTITLTADVTGSGTGSFATTLATVNSSVGSFTAASITVNAKGLVTAASTGTTGNLTDAGTDGIVVTGGTGAVFGSGTSLAQHVADSTHNGYLSSTDWSTFNGKQASGSYLTALTGDITASGPGSAAATLATVNSNVGSFTNASITVNAKGLITAASTGTSGGVTTVGSFSGSSQANGASISTTTITFGPADATNPGMVTTGTQTMAGAKTFSTTVNSPKFFPGPSADTSYFSGTLISGTNYYLSAFSNNISNAVAEVMRIGYDTTNHGVCIYPGSGFGTDGSYAWLGFTSGGQGFGPYQDGQKSNASTIGCFMGFQAVSLGVASTYVVVGGTTAGNPINVPLVFNTDNTADIGKLSATNFRPRTVYVGTSVVVPTVSNTAGVAVSGTNTNDSAASGFIGEYIESVVGSPTNMSASATYQDATSISLTAGDWDVSFILDAISNSALGISLIQFGIGTATGNSSAGLTFGSNALAFSFATALGNGAEWGIAIPPFRVSLSATTTQYGKIYITYPTTAAQFRCRLSARRVR